MTKKNKHKPRRSRTRSRARIDVLDAFATQAPIGIFANDADGRCIYVNQECSAKLGVPAGDLLGDGWVRHLHPDDRARVTAAWRDSVTRGGRFEAEYRFRRPAGDVIWVLCRFVRMARALGEARYIGLLLDITGRKQAEFQLSESRNRTQAVLDASPLAIASLDLQGRVEAWNRGAERLFGWTEADVIGQPCPPIAQEQQGSFRELLGRALESGPVHGLPHDCRNRAGEAVRAAISLAPLLDGAGEKVGVVAAFDDLTAYERMLRQLRELIDGHERLVQDLHDTCIQSIFAVGLGLEECRRLVSVNPPRAISAIGAAAANLNLVIQDLRAFISGRRAGDVEVRDFRAELERMVQAAGSQGPAFVVDVDDRALQSLLPAQVLQLLHIAREGISNIVRHAKARNGRVALRLTARCVRLEISDDGRGFNSRAGERRGLGLHHMRARAGKLRGRWRMASTAGRGTRLVVDLQRPP